MEGFGVEMAMYVLGFDGKRLKGIRSVNDRCCWKEIHFALIICLFVCLLYSAGTEEHAAVNSLS
jgi:hypothetical protein